MGKSGFDGINPHIAQLAQTLQENGLAASAIDAISLANSISIEEGTPGSEPYGSEKIPNRHPTERPKKEGWMIDNLTPEECGPPVSHLNKERKPGKIENVPLKEEPAPRPPERKPAPESTPAVFLQETPVEAETVEEATTAPPEAPEEAPKEDFEHPADDPAVRDILDADAHLIYGPPITACEEEEESAAEPEPVEEPITPPEQPREEPVITPAEPEPPKREEQAESSPHPEGSEPSTRGRGLSVEEEEMTDITKIFNYGNK